MVPAFVAEKLGAQHQQGGPDPLAALGEEVFVDLGDEGIGRASELFERSLNGVEVALDGSIDVVERRGVGGVVHSAGILAKPPDFIK
jgi:hypothetical protein